MELAGRQACCRRRIEEVARRFRRDADVLILFVFIGAAVLAIKWSTIKSDVCLVCGNCDCVYIVCIDDDVVYILNSPRLVSAVWVIAVGRACTTEFRRNDQRINTAR